jgi:hypothetical protein
VTKGEISMELNLEDATKLIISFLRNPDYGSYSHYGYDLYLPSAMHIYLSKENQGRIDAQLEFTRLSPIIYAAAWELCRRGIIRPGVKKHGAQATDDGQGGNGYSVTPFGKKWLEEGAKDDFVPTEPERFGEMLAPYSKRFGPGFYERAQQAIRCYGAHAYLACCAMCGAAAESILLTTAIKKNNDENEVLKLYGSANGRYKVENLVVGKIKEPLQRDYRSYVNLLKYWRDESAHGRSSKITENEAYTSLALLLRFAMLVSDNWEELIKDS